MNVCKEHRTQWDERAPGCAYCLAREVARLKEHVTQCQTDGSAAVLSRRDAIAKLRKAEHEVLKLRDEVAGELRKIDHAKFMEHVERFEKSAMTFSLEELEKVSYKANSQYDYAMMVGLSRALFNRLKEAESRLKYQHAIAAQRDNFSADYDKIKSELLRLADACIQRHVGDDWPAIEIMAKHVIEKYRPGKFATDLHAPTTPAPEKEITIVELEKRVYDYFSKNEPTHTVDPQVLLALCKLRDDLDDIGAGGWKVRVVEIIRLMTGKDVTESSFLATLRAENELIRVERDTARMAIRAYQARIGRALLIVEDIGVEYAEVAARLRAALTKTEGE